MSGAKGGSVINDSVEKEIGSLAWPCYSPPGLGFRTPEDWSELSFPLKKKTKNKKENASNRAVTLATFGCRWGDRRAGGTQGRRDPACPNCRHSAAASITTAVGLFLQSRRLGPGPRQQLSLKNLA